MATTLLLSLSSATIMWTVAAAKLAESHSDAPQNVFQPKTVYDKTNPAFRFLPDPDELAKLVTHGRDDEIKLFKDLYTSALQLFDLEGYNWLMSGVPGVNNMAMMSLMMVKGLIQAVASTVMDIVPPLIPPPVWIMRYAMPWIKYKRQCLPRDVLVRSKKTAILVLPGFNSSLIQCKHIPHLLDAYRYGNEGFIRSRDTGLHEAMSMPICFPQCLATLVACPGFWLEDIEGPCSDLSLTSFEESHPYPKECPKFNPLYDTPDDVFDVTEPLPSPIKPEAAPPMAGKQLKDYAQVQPPKRVEPPPCNCSDMQRRCSLHEGIPVEIEANKTRPATHYQIPATFPDRCCTECREVVKAVQSEMSAVETPSPTSTSTPPVQEERQTSNVGP